MRGWLSSNWLEFLITVLIAVIDVAVVTPWILLLVVTLDGDGLSAIVPIGAGIIGVVSFWLARELLNRMWDLAAMRMLSLGAWLALLILWYGAVTGSGFAAPLHFIDNLLQFDGVAFGLVFLGGAAWWRGIWLAATEDLFASDFVRMAVMRTVIAHGGVLIVAAALSDPVTSEILSFATLMIPLGFGACLIVATAVQVRSARENIKPAPDQRRPGRGWLGAGAGITAAVLLIATFIAGTAGREIWQILLWPFIQVLHGLNWLLDWVILGFALVGYFLLLPLFWLFEQFVEEGQQEEFTRETGDALERPEQSPGQPDFIPETVLQVAQWAVAVVIVALVVWFALRQLKRMQDRMRRSEEGELRESMWSTDLLLSDLGAMLRGLRRDLWSRRPRFDLGRPPEDVRDAYQHVIVHGGREGIPRDDRESALRYSDRIKQTEPGVGDALDDLTERYLRARYGEETSDEDVQLSRADWDAIRQRLRRQQQGDGG